MYRKSLTITLINELLNCWRITDSCVDVALWSYIIYHMSALKNIAIPRRGLQTYTKHSKLLTHWGRVTHICVSKLTVIGSDNGLSPDRRQAIIWTSAGILLIGPLGTNLSEILIEILTFSFKKMRLRVSSAKRRPFCLGLNGLMYY